MTAAGRETRAPTIGPPAQPHDWVPQMSASSGLSQSLPLSFVKEHSHVLGALSRLPCGALVSLVAPWLVSSIDWGNDGQVDISDKLFGVNCGVLCLAIQLFYCVVAQYSVAPDHPLMGVLQALNIRTGVLSQRQKLVVRRTHQACRESA